MARWRAHHGMRAPESASTPGPPFFGSIRFSRDCAAQAPALGAAGSMLPGGRGGDTGGLKPSLIISS